VPVRAGRFVARKNWIVAGSDDFQLRVINYNTSEKVTSFEAHPDYIRAIAIHPTQPFCLTASDDMTIKLWDWEKAWKCVQVFDGHSHYVMCEYFGCRFSQSTVLMLLSNCNQPKGHEYFCVCLLGPHSQNMVSWLKYREFHSGSARSKGGV
jgi:WD40 repeat protein